MGGLTGAGGGSAGATKGGRGVALEQEKNEWVASLEQEEVLLEQQKGEEVSLLEQEHLVPQRISEGQLQKHSSCSP